MRSLASAIVTIVLVTASLPLSAQQGATVVPRSREYWFAYAGKLPVGSTVRVRTIDGKRQTAVLAVVDQEGITLELKTRVPEPPRRIPFEQLEQLELKKNGSSVARNVAIGTAVGAGTFLGIVMILAAAMN